MPLVLELGILLLLFPPLEQGHGASQVTEREHYKRKGACLKTRTICDLKNFFAKVQRETCRQILTHSMQMFPVVANRVIRVSLLAEHGVEFPSAPRAQSVFPACHCKLLATDIPEASTFARNGMSGLSKVGLQAEKTMLALTMRCASAAPTKHRAHPSTFSPLSAQQ